VLFFVWPLCCLSLFDSPLWCIQDLLATHNRETCHISQYSFRDPNEHVVVFFFRTIRFYGFIFFFAEYCWIRCCEQIQYCIINFTLFHNIDCYQLSMYVVKPISTYLYANLMTKMLLFQLTKYQVMYRVYASRIRLPISLKVFVVTIHLMT
jgi:hypothetical protein